MTEDIRHLPPSELDIMLMIWALKPPVTAPQILYGMGRNLTTSALHSYLKRLEEKGFLSCRRVGKTNRYTPLITRETYQALEGRTLLDKLYRHSLKDFTAALYDGGALDRQELDELRAYLDTLEQEVT